MAKARMTAKLAVGCLLLWGSTLMAAPPPSAADMLRFRPKQEGVVYTTPGLPEQETCKVEPIRRGPQGKEATIGWLLRDPKGLVLRRFFDTTGNGKTDAWCYYNNGVEVYREIYTAQGDHYRWLNSGGMKWGVDLNHDGKIDHWRNISAEEVSQEVLQAVLKRDFSRLQPLMLSEADIKTLDLPAAEVTRIRESLKGAQAKFTKTLADLGALGDKVRWVHLEAPPPQCLPTDATGMKQDFIKYNQAVLTFVNEANNKTGELLLGELIQVGQAWRFIDAPLVKPDGPDRDTPTNKDLQAALDELKKLDDKAPKPDDPQVELAKYNLKRAEILDRIASLSPPDDREQWIRQVADSLGAAVQNSPKDRTPYQRLEALKNRIVKESPTTPLAAHLVFCEMSADYASKLIGEPSPDIQKLQQEWVDKLAKFVQEYPKAEDAPDALIQLGMVCELLGKEDQAKKWYELLLKDFPASPQALKGKGSLNRLTLEGKELVLTGHVIGSGAAFDVKSLKTKVVVVYYWASWNQQSATDFTRLKTLQTSYAAKGLEIICVNLDDDLAAATAFLQKNPAPGTQMFEKGGLSSPLAEPFGIQVLPTMFLVGKEGKVINRNVQMTNLEDEVKKATN